MPMKRIGNHVFVQMSKPTMKVNFTGQQLYKLHKTFFHPSIENQFKLMLMIKLPIKCTDNSEKLSFNLTAP